MGFDHDRTRKRSLGAARARPATADAQLGGTQSSELRKSATGNLNGSKPTLPPSPSMSFRQAPAMSRHEERERAMRTYLSTGRAVATFPTGAVTLEVNVNRLHNPDAEVLTPDVGNNIHGRPLRNAQLARKGETMSLTVTPPAAVRIGNGYHASSAAELLPNQSIHSVGSGSVEYLHQLGRTDSSTLGVPSVRSARRPPSAARTRATVLSFVHSRFEPLPKPTQMAASVSDDALDTPSTPPTAGPATMESADERRWDWSMDLVHSATGKATHTVRKSARQAPHVFEVVELEDFDGSAGICHSIRHHKGLFKTKFSFHAGPNGEEWVWKGSMHSFFNLRQYNRDGTKDDLANLLLSSNQHPRLEILDSCRAPSLVTATIYPILKMRTDLYSKHFTSEETIEDLARKQGLDPIEKQLRSRAFKKAQRAARSAGPVASPAPAATWSGFTHPVPSPRRTASIDGATFSIVAGAPAPEHEEMLAHEPQPQPQLVYGRIEDPERIRAAADADALLQSQWHNGGAPLGPRLPKSRQRPATADAAYGRRESPAGYYSAI